MEYMPITLSQIIKEGGFKNRKIDINQVIRYAKGMLKALAYLDVLFNSYSNLVYAIVISNLQTSSLIRSNMVLRYAILAQQKN